MGAAFFGSSPALERLSGVEVFPVQDAVGWLDLGEQEWDAAPIVFIVNGGADEAEFGQADVEGGGPVGGPMEAGFPREDGLESFLGSEVFPGDGVNMVFCFGQGRGWQRGRQVHAGPFC